MTQWASILFLLAQQNGEQNGANGPPGNLFSSPWFLFAIIAVLWFFILIRPQRKERARRDEMLKNMKKNDRVVTIGGMIGTVANLSPDGREVTLKIDDNTRVTMLRNSIQGLYTKADESPESAGKN